VPEVEKILLGAPDAAYLRPLLYGLLESSAGIELLADFPSQLALKLQQRTDALQCAFLSPIDYAHHGGDYVIVPGVGVTSSSRSETIQLFINPDVRNVGTIAVDIRVTSEIILAKVILAEKFPNLASAHDTIQFIPMIPDRDKMLRKADAALIVNFYPLRQIKGEPFALDLVDEWNDMTGLPYVHGVWVGHDEASAQELVNELVRARDRGVSHLAEIAERLSTEREMSREIAKKYFSRFSYAFGEEEQQGFTEFVQYAYYHAILPDVPDLNFFDAAEPPAQPVN
jgi:chorismate dehydratase